MGAILLQEDKLICYHSKNFSGTILNNPTYDKEMYVLVQALKKWKYYLMGKEKNHSFLQILTIPKLSKTPLWKQERNTHLNRPENISNMSVEGLKPLICPKMSMSIQLPLFNHQDAHH